MIIEALRSFKRRLFGERRAGLGSPTQWLIDAFTGGPTQAGISVNEQTALNLSTVWGCTRVISETVALLSWPVYERVGESDKERALDFPLYKILHDKPNPLMTSFIFRETLTAHILLWGNAYAEILRNQAGSVRELWPITPDCCSPKILDSGELVYEVKTINGPVDLPAERVLHIKGLGYDGLVGYSVVQKARESIGVGMAAEKYGASFFGNGARPAGVLKHPGMLKEDARRRIRDSWQSQFTGDNQQRTAILEDGMEYTAVSVPPEDAQFLETRQFQVPDICRWFRVPPHKVQDLTRATFSNIEHQAIEFVTDTILPWVKRWETEVNTKLIGPNQQQRYFSEMIIETLLRGDLASRYSAYATGRQWGWLSANDVLQLENRNSIGEEGDIYLSPSNMVPAEDVGQEPEPAPMPMPAEEGEEDEDGLQLVNAASKRLFEQALTRCFEREKKAITARVKKYGYRDTSHFQQYITDFYQRHLAVMRESLDPLVQSYQELCGQTPDPMPGWTFTAQYCDSRKSLLVVGYAAKSLEWTDPPAADELMERLLWNEDTPPTEK